jgi:hypothetical protein
MREGHIADETAQTLINLSRPLNYPDGIEPTQLSVTFKSFCCRLSHLSKRRFPLRTEVEKANNSRLEKLPLPAHTYIATDWPGHDSKMKPISREKAKRLLNDLVTPPEISLRVCDLSLVLRDKTNQSHPLAGRRSSYAYTGTFFRSFIIKGITENSRAI